MVVWPLANANHRAAILCILSMGALSKSYHYTHPLAWLTGISSRNLSAKKDVLIPKLFLLRLRALMTIILNAVGNHQQHLIKFTSNTYSLSKTSALYYNKRKQATHLHRLRPSCLLNPLILKNHLLFSYR